MIDKAHPTHDERVRLKAYEIWLNEGRPEGRDARHWEMAREAIGYDDALARPWSAGRGDRPARPLDEGGARLSDQNQMAGPRDGGERSLAPAAEAAKPRASASLPDRPCRGKRAVALRRSDAAPAGVDGSVMTRVERRSIRHDVSRRVPGPAPYAEQLRPRHSRRRDRRHRPCAGGRAARQARRGHRPGRPGQWRFDPQFRFRHGDRPGARRCLAARPALPRRLGRSRAQSGHRGRALRALPSSAGDRRRSP